MKYYKERSEIMEKEFTLEVLKECVEEMKDRNRFAEKISKRGWTEGWEKVWEEGLAEGEAKSICLGIRNLLKSGMSISQIAQMSEVSVEKLQSWLEDENILAKELMETSNL